MWQQSILRAQANDSDPAYASFVNVLDYTNIVIPVTTANSKIDVFDHDYQPLNERDKKNWEACEFPLSAVFPVTSNCSLTIDDPDNYDGAPAAVQILGRRLGEEKLLSVALRVLEALQKHRGPLL